MPSSSNRLRQVLGLGFGLAVIIGSTIGVGILRTPGEVAAYLPNGLWFMLAWVVGGLYALLSALSIAELGAMIPQSGGQYVQASDIGRVLSALSAAVPQTLEPERRDLWHQPWAFMLVLLLLGTEWVLRRLWGLR